MISAVDPQVVVADASVTIVVLPVVVATTMTTTVVVEEVVVATRPAMMTVILASVTTALVTAVMTTEVLVALIVMLAVKTDMAAVAVPVATTGTAAVMVMTVVLPGSLSLTVTVLARTLLVVLHPPMRLPAHPKAAGATEVATKTTVPATGDRPMVAAGPFANHLSRDTRFGAAFNTCFFVLDQRAVYPSTKHVQITANFSKSFSHPFPACTS